MSTHEVSIEIKIIIMNKCYELLYKKKYLENRNFNTGIF